MPDYGYLVKSQNQYLTPHEVEVLKMLAGERQGEWGAWVGACLELLAAHGYCTNGPNYQITDAGRKALEEISANL